MKKKYILVSWVNDGTEEGISLTDLKSRKKVVERLGSTWLGLVKGERTWIGGYDFCVFVVNDDIELEKLFDNEKIMNSLETLAEELDKLKNEAEEVSGE